MKNIKFTLIILLVFLAIFSIETYTNVYSENLSIPLTKTIENINSTENIEYDIDNNGVIDILDVANSAYNLGYIDIEYIEKNYVDIISDKDKEKYEQVGYSILSQKCFPVTAEGVDLFAYVTAAEGMSLEVIEGDNSFTVENDRLYLKGQAPAIAKVRLVNAYAQSEPFYLYGTSDREIHDFTYDYLLKLANE